MFLSTIIILIAVESEEQNKNQNLHKVFFHYLPFHFEPNDKLW